MTDEDKIKECRRICGDRGRRGMHRLAPELCPILEEVWKNPRLKEEWRRKLKEAPRTAW